jgi:hypothetical protein
VFCDGFHFALEFWPTHLRHQVFWRFSFLQNSSPVALWNICVSLDFPLLMNVHLLSKRGLPPPRQERRTWNRQSCEAGLMCMSITLAWNEQEPGESNAHRQMTSCSTTEDLYGSICVLVFWVGYDHGLKASSRNCANLFGYIFCRSRRLELSV